MVRRVCLTILIIAITFFAGVGAAGHVRGLWLVVPVGEEQVLYVDSFDGVCSIGWYSNNSQQGLLGQTTGRWMAGTDLTGKITPYYGSPSSEHEPQIRAQYIDVTYVGHLPWLDGGGVGGKSGTNEWWTWYLVVSPWLLVAVLVGLTLVLFFWGRRRRAAADSEDALEHGGGPDQPD